VPGEVEPKRKRGRARTTTRLPRRLPDPVTIRKRAIQSIGTSSGSVAEVRGKRATGGRKVAAGPYGRAGVARGQSRLPQRPLSSADLILMESSPALTANRSSHSAPGTTVHPSSGPGSPVVARCNFACALGLEQVDFGVLVGGVARRLRDLAGLAGSPRSRLRI